MMKHLEVTRMLSSDGSGVDWRYFWRCQIKQTFRLQEWLFAVTHNSPTPHKDWRYVLGQYYWVSDKKADFPSPGIASLFADPQTPVSSCFETDHITISASRLGVRLSRNSRTLSPIFQELHPRQASCPRFLLLPQYSSHDFACVQLLPSRDEMLTSEITVTARMMKWR